MYRRRVLAAAKEERASRSPSTGDAVEAELLELQRRAALSIRSSACRRDSGAPHAMKFENRAELRGSGEQADDLSESEEVQLIKHDRRQHRRMLHELHRCMARSGAVAVAASASALSRGIDRIAQLDEVSKFRRRSARSRDLGVAAGSGSPRCRLALAAEAVAGQIGSVPVFLAANLSDGLRDLAAAIGEPPHRGAPEEVPTILLWALNLLVVCCLLGALCMLSAFYSQGFAADQDPVLRVVEQASARPSSNGVRVGLRVAAMSGISFLAGMGLRVVHPLQSAVLSGF